jgi:hypothetical protein
VDGWAIDSYGLRAACRQSVFDRLQVTDRLHVSSLTWTPVGEVQADGNGSIFNDRIRSKSSRRLTLVDGDTRRPNDGPVSFGTQLANLHNKGILVVADDHECDPRRVVEVEGSWATAGLVWRPTNETIAAVMTADRLGLDLITEDSDARKLANYWHVNPMTVTEFASSLAA